MAETFRIRQAEPADAAAIRTLVDAAYAKWIPLIGRLPTPMQANYAQAVLNHRFDLLQSGEGLAALIETLRRDDDLLIVNVAVHPHHQGRGYGTELLAHAESIAAEAGLPRLRLYTNKKYTANLRLYAALGYRVEREELYGGPGRTLDDDITVHMVKDLGPSRHRA